jgi:hypothetical protein
MLVVVNGCWWLLMVIVLVAIAKFSIGGYFVSGC